MSLRKRGTAGIHFWEVSTQKKKTKKMCDKDIPGHSINTGMYLVDMCG